MVPILSLIFITVLICLFEFPKLIKKEQYKEMVVFAFIVFVGFFLFLALLLDLNIPKPGPLFIDLVESNLPAYFEFMTP